MSMEGLHTRHALVTGGSRGIGRAIVLRFLAEGLSISTCARSQEGLDLLMRATGEVASRLHTAVIDVTDEAAVREWVTLRGTEHGSIDILVSNASAMSSPGSAWRAHTDIDLLGFVGLVDEALPYLTKSTDASIVAIASTAAIETFGRNAAAPYGAVKAAVIHHALTLARRLAPHGIRSNAVSPGPVLFEGGAWDHIRREQPEFFDKVVRSIPRGQMASPDDVAAAVSFLSSRDAANITGINLVTDGGMTQRVNF